MKATCDVRLLSDTCLGGNGIPGGVIDTEVVTDAYGIPCIPGKRIKGLFREMAMEAAEFGLVSKETVEEVFGKKGDSKEVIYFQTLYPKGYEQLCAFLDKAQKDANWKEYANKNKVLAYFTTVRSQTALEESGVAKENSLRMIRVIKKGIQFSGIVECASDISKEKRDLLEYCAKMIRHIGINRTRGMGNVECKLTFDEILVNVKENEKLKKKMEDYKSKNSYDSSDDEFLPVRICLKQPCVMEKDYIAGNVLRGAYAATFSRYMKNADLHTNPLFHDLFFSNKVKFGYCWPVKVSESKEKLYWPTPNSFVEMKKVSDGFIYDLAAAELDELDENLNEKERCKYPFVNMDDANAYHCGVERAETYHHRRPEDRSVGHALKSKGAAKVSDGQLYTREFICEGQEFYGEIRGASDLLEILKIIVPSNETFYVGASRTAEYGMASISYQPIKEERESVEVEDRIVITLLSPMVVKDAMGNDTTDVNQVLNTILGDALTEDAVVKCYCKEEIVSGYNAKWNMPFVQRNVLQPGSVIVIYGQELDEEEIETLNQHSYGLYQNEGYGRIFVNLHGEREKLRDAGEYARLPRRVSVPTYGACLNMEHQKYIDACLVEKVLTLCSQQADTDFFYKLKKYLQKVPNSHVLSGLQQIYKTSKNFKEFGEQLKDAASRSKKSNSAWFMSIYDCIFMDEMQISDRNNVFCKQGVAKIDECKFGVDYKDRMKELLETNAYKYFTEIFGPMIYDVHLALDNKGGK